MDQNQHNQHNQHNQFNQPKRIHYTKKAYTDYHTVPGPADRGAPSQPSLIENVNDGSPADSWNKPQKTKKRRIYQLGVEIPCNDNTKECK